MNAIFWFVLQLGNGLTDDISEQIDQPCAGLHLSPVGREGESVLRDFEQSHTERPNVGGDGV